MARLLLRAESCAQILAKQEYGRTVRDTQVFMLGMTQCLYLLQGEDREVCANYFLILLPMIALTYDCYLDLFAECSIHRTTMQLDSRDTFVLYPPTISKVRISPCLNMSCSYINKIANLKSTWSHMSHRHVTMYSRLYKPCIHVCSLVLVSLEVIP